MNYIGDVETRDLWTAMELTVSPPPAPPAEALPAPPPLALMPASSSRALTPRTNANISRTVPRKFPREYESRSRSWLATQVWNYFDDSGYETSTAPGVAGHLLRAQHKCRCLYCDQVVRATPAKMATHIVSRCQIADHAAKRALRTGKTDVLTTMVIAKRPKPSRPECSLVALKNWLSNEDFQEASGVFLSSVSAAKPDAEIAKSPSAFATYNHAPTTLLPVLDYVSAFKWDSSQISVRSGPSTCFSGENNANDQTVSLEEAARQAEEMIFSCTSKREIAREPSCGQVPWRNDEDVQGSQRERRLAVRQRDLIATPCAESRTFGATTARLTSEPDKENMPPPSEPKDSKLDCSTAKKRKLESQSQRDPLKILKVQVPGKKKLFGDILGSESSEDLQPPSTCDFETLVRGLTMACITENVPIAFLSSAAFKSTIKTCCDVPENVNFAQVSSKVLGELASQVDAVCDSMKTSSSHLTFVVKRASVNGSWRAVVYLVDESAESILISCQQGNHQNSAGRGIDVWLDEVRCHYLSVSEWCGRPLHVCVSNYPMALQRELLEAIDPSTRLFGGCMVEEFALLRQHTMKLLRGTSNVVQGCAELALLVNEAERFPLLRRKSNPATRLSIPEPCGDSVFGYAVLLKQVILAKEELVAKYQVAHAEPRTRVTKTSDILARVKEILDAIEDQWMTTISETLQLLLPLAFVELVKFNSLVSLSTAVKLTSGSLFCVELWLFITILRSPLLTSADKMQWKKMFLSRCRATRMDHQLAGLLLDPRIVGAGLSPVGLRAGRACVVELCQRLYPRLNTRNLAPQLVDYLNKTGIFSSHKLWLTENTASPVSFWRGVQDAPELREVALLVCSYAPVSPAVSGEVKLPGASSNFDQATRVAQVRHHLQTREVIREAQSISSHLALKLLNFIAPESTTKAEGKLDEGSLGSNPALFEPKQFSWGADNQSKVASQQSILQASQVYVMSLRSTIEGAEDQHRANKFSMQEASSRSSNFQLEQFSESWIDCSDTRLQAIHDAVSCLIAI